MPDSDPSARPSPQDRRRRYLQIARELFAQHGYAGTSMDMIVARAGGSKATLYKHFPAKHSLIEGLMAEIATVIRRGQPDDASEDLTLRQALLRMARAALEGVLSADAIMMFRIAVGEQHQFPELARVVWDSGPATTYRNFCTFLHARRQRGELDFDDAQLAAEHFIAGTVGHLQPKIAMGLADKPSTEEIARRAEAAVDTFLARYATRGPAKTT